MRLKSAMEASRFAPAIAGMSWSTQAGMRWVPISPVVEAPHTKRLPDSSQKSRERSSPTPRAESAARIGLPLLGTATLAPRSSPYAGEPYVLRPVPHQERHSKRNRTEGRGGDGKRHQPPAEIRRDAGEQRKNKSWPAAVAEASRPTTMPSRALNHRMATVAASTLAVKPAPEPTMKPHSKTNCQDCCINGVAATPMHMEASAINMMLLIAKLFVIAAANGPIRP